MARLIVVDGEPAGGEFHVAGSVTLGRSPECDLTLPGVLVSRMHARISAGDGSYSIEDLGSANGTQVNGRTVDRASLHDGDRIMVGACELAFVMDGDSTASQVPSRMETSEPEVLSSVGMDNTLSGVALEGTSGAARLREHLEAVQKVARASCGALDIEDLLELILDQLLSVFPQADSAYAVLRGMAEDGSDLCLSAGAAGGGMSRTLLHMVTESREAVLVRDILSDGRLNTAQSIVGQDIRSTMCCPLEMASEVGGALQVDTTSISAPFGDADLRLLATVAGEAAVAAENARMHGVILQQQRLAATGQAVSSIAHCMKNVLNGLRGGSYILDLGIQKDSPERVEKGWDMVKRNIGFISELAQDMLAYCGKRHLNRQPTDVPEMLRETVDMVREHGAQEEVKVSLAPDERLPAWQVDPTALKRVVLNLLSNAIDACSPGDRVEVRAGQDEASGDLCIAVKDDGPGIPPDVQERLFEPFFTTKGHKGTGLGLALVKKVVEEHGGRVELDSEPGRGTVFRLMLPGTRTDADTKVDEE